MDKISDEFSEAIKQKPYSLQKASVESLSLLRSFMNTFTQICNQTFQKEISKYNKEEADKIQNEINFHYEKQ